MTYFGEQFEAQNTTAREEALAAGKITVTEPDQATLDAWQAATQPAIDAWLAQDADNAALLSAYKAAMTD